MESVNGQIIKKIKDLKKDAIRYAPALIIPALLSLLTIGIFTRIFNPDQYGQYVLVVAVAAIITNALSVYSQSSILRFYPKFKNENDGFKFLQHFAIMIFITILFLCVLAAALFPFKEKIFGEFAKFYFAAFLMIVFGIIFENLTAFFRAKLEPQKYSKYRVGFSGLYTLLAISFIFIVLKDVVSIIFAFSVSYLVISLFMSRELGLWQLRGLLRDIDFNYIRKFAVYGFPLVGWMVGFTILNLSDRFLIELFRSTQEVGIYAAAYDLIGKGFGLISSPVMLAAHPLIINMWESGQRENVGKVIINFSRYFLLAGLPVVMLISLFSSQLIRIVLGAQFQESYVVVPFIAASFFLWGLGMFMHKGLELAEKTRPIFFSIFVCIILNILLNIIFIPKFGYIAAAATTLVSFMFYPILIYRLTPPAMRWAMPWRSLGSGLSSCLASAGILVILKKYFFCGETGLFLIGFLMMLGLVIYAVVLYFLGEYKNYELAYVKKSLRLK
ncbi:MAG: oligosaccharide flippase family protein [Candidatus Omnitrophota bacterium]